MTVTDPAPAPTTVLEHALYLAALGYRVLPIRPGSKHPPIPAWQNAATSNPETITAWWTGLYRGHGIGIATGRMTDGRQFFALDIDEGPDKNGGEELAHLTQLHGPLPDTVTSHTGSGGRHILLTVPPGVECPRNNQSGLLAPGLDIRGEGGQIVVAPTIHPNGQPYVWEIGAAPGDIDVAPAPWWLIGLLEARGTVTAKQNHPTNRHIPSQFSSPNDDGPAQRYNDRTTWADLLTADGWTLTEQMTDGEQRWTRPGKTAREGASATVGHEGRDVLKVFTSSVPGLEADRAYSRFGYHAATRHAGDRSTAARAILAGETPTLTVIHTDPLEAATAVAEADTVLLAMLVDWPTFWADDNTDADWLTEPVLAAGRAHAIYAPGGTGKSLFALWLAAQLATGGRGLGNEPLTPTRVLYLDYEMTRDDVAERLGSMGYDEHSNLDNFHYALLPPLAPADQPEGGQQIVRLAELVNAELVVLDTFSRAVDGDENDADTVRDFYRHTGRALKQAGRAFARIDHAGKDIDRGQRGSSAKNDDVDIVWQMVKADDGFTLTAKKRRMGWVPETINLKQHDDPRLCYSIASERVPPGTADAIARLDELGINPALSIRKTRAALAAAGTAPRTEVVAAAQKQRKRGRLDPPKVFPDNPGNAHTFDSGKHDGKHGKHPDEQPSDQERNDGKHYGKRRETPPAADGVSPVTLLRETPAEPENEDYKPW